MNHFTPLPRFIPGPLTPETPIDTQNGRRTNSRQNRGSATVPPAHNHQTNILLPHEFTNYSRHPVVYGGRTYPTSDHLFQSFKFQGHRPDIAEHIRNCPQSAGKVSSEVRRYKDAIRHDWSNVNVAMMDLVLWHKFNQHSDLKTTLLSTGSAGLINNSDHLFWGTGTHGQGRNELGKALERLRARLGGTPSYSNPATTRRHAYHGAQASIPYSSRPRILFYHKNAPYYGFTNFSNHPVMYRGKEYPTSEHLFQSFKFLEHRPDIAEIIRTCSLWPSTAFSEAHRYTNEVRKDWMHVNIAKMDETLWHKFDQHPGLKAELLSTGNAELVEDSDKDSFWGIGSNGKGRNELGKALEKLRAKLATTRVSHVTERHRMVHHT